MRQFQARASRRKALRSEIVSFRQSCVNGGNHSDGKGRRIGAGLFLREIGEYEISTWLSFRNYVKLALGWFDADEEHVPFDVFTSCSWASPRERLVEHYEVSDLIDLRQKPVGNTATASASGLPTQQLDRAVENPVVMWFGNAVLAMIDKTNHAHVVDGSPEQRMRLQRHP